MTEADVLRMLSMSTEVSIACFSNELRAHENLQFDQLQVRETEVEELKGLMEIIPCTVKVNKLLSTAINCTDTFSRTARIRVRAK